MAQITICSDFGPPKNKVCHCFHSFPIYLPWRKMGGGSKQMIFQSKYADGQWHMKRCLTSGKCKSESQWAITSHWSRMTVFKKTTNDNNWWGCGEEGTLRTVGGNVNCCRHCGKQCVVQSLSCFQLFDPMDCGMPGFLVLHHLTELAQTHVHLADDAIQPCHPLSPLLLLPSIFPSIRVFSTESALQIR